MQAGYMLTANVRRVSATSASHLQVQQGLLRRRCRPKHSRVRPHALAAEQSHRVLRWDDLRGGGGGMDVEEATRAAAGERETWERVQ